MLFDKTTKKVTAILDFDFCCVSNPLDEFFSILSDLGCNITYKDDAISTAILSGDFTTLPTALNKESAEKWAKAKAWSATLKKAGAVSPSDIDGAARIRDLALFQALLCPFQLSSEDALKDTEAAKTAALRANTEADLSQWLEKHGF